MPARIARGRLRSFSLSTWEAHVVLDGSQAQVIMPVGEWISPNLLAAGDDVAVLLFEETNPDDGVVLGSYGSTPGDLFVGARVYHTANQSISHATGTELAFNSERYDSNAFHSTSSNNSRLTVPTGLGGKYLISANVKWTAGTGYRELALRRNAATLIAVDSREAAPTYGTYQELTTLYQLDAADYVEARVYQESGGGSLNVEVAGNYSPEFMLARLP
jgi:hypothetical protein